MMSLRDEEREWWREDAMEVQGDDTMCKPRTAASEETPLPITWSVRKLISIVQVTQSQVQLWQPLNTKQATQILYDKVVFEGLTTGAFKG